MNIEEYLTKLCQHVGLADDQFEVKITPKEEILDVVVNLPDEESGLFIGYHGETMRSLQQLLRVSFYEELEGKYLHFSVNDYRQQRQEQLEERATQAAQQVIESGQPYTFPYLNSRDRFVVHSYLSQNPEFDQLESRSEGEGDQRYLTIRLKNQNE